METLIIVSYVMRGRCWFAMDSNSFDLSVEEVVGRLRGVIVERGRGFSVWIRFGDQSLRSLLKGAKVYCRNDELRRWNNVWEENGRNFNLERRANGAGRFILCLLLQRLRSFP